MHLEIQPYETYHPHCEVGCSTTYFASIGLIGVPARTEILAESPFAPSVINFGTSKS